MEQLKIAMLLFPDLTLLDFAGPYDVFTRKDYFRVCTVAQTTGEIKAEGGLTVRADYSFDNCPAADILFVPGGKGITALLNDASHLQFLRKQGITAQYITSVCTGALLLAAAGLLNGYKATTHWRSLELLKMFGVETIDERVVADKNRITGGGVTAGIDFALMLAAIVGGADEAMLCQLNMEYAPQPPFDSGSPATASAHIIEKAKQMTAVQFEKRKEIISGLVK
jgi:cyclohexyl-isocyanide hydratase